MRILFVMRNTLYVRNFESTLRMLAARGHEIDVVAEPHSLAEANALLERLTRECPSIRHSLPPALRFNAWSFLGFELRRAIDYLRYLGPEYEGKTKLRNRAERGAPEFAMSAARHPQLGTATGRRLLTRLLRCADRAVPRDSEVDAFVSGFNPDLMLVTPLVEPGSPQSEFLRSARALGVRTGLCVYSWDNLTNKGLIHDRLDLVTVWNEAMKDEAVTLHQVPADRIAVTGAAAFDHWFGWQTRETRAQFCARVGLRADRAYLLYLCSSKFIAPDEAPFVRSWITRLRSASSRLQEVGVLVRPHPQNMQHWKTTDLSDLDNVAVWPRAGANPVDAESRADYYDSIAHSIAVVGVNTSAQIESAIVGRPVYTLLADEFQETQEGTLHFEHLRSQGGGLLHVARTFEEHTAHLEAAISSPGDDGRCRRFVERFVRPGGVDKAATPVLVEAIERVGSLGRRRPDRGPWYAALARPILARAAVRVANTRLGRKEKAACRERLRARHELERSLRIAERTAQKANAAAARDERRRVLQLEREAARTEAQNVAARAFENYGAVREQVRAMGDSSDAALTAVEVSTLAALAHFRDASPQVIGSLRRHCGPISGVRAEDYDRITRDLKARLGSERRILQRGVPEGLFVSESPMLGGFGVARAGELYNEDTLRYAKALVALHDGAVLPQFRDSSRRQVVWEIGGGWGGFAYQFKTLFPNVTYVISGLPEILLVSGVYLTTMFPGSCVRFVAPGMTSADVWRDGSRADFVFVPERELDLLAPPRLDLVVDILALRTMGAARAEAHVQRAYDLGARYFYSLLPADGETGEADHWAARQRFWAHPVPPRADRIPPVIDLDGGPPIASDHAHMIGWRRLHA